MQHNLSVEQSAKLHAAEVRKRLFAAPQNKPVLRIAAPLQERIDMLSKGKDEPEDRRRFAADLPGWKIRPTVFNSHVIDYRRYLIDAEYEMAGIDAPCSLSMNEIAIMVLKDYPGISVEEIKGTRRTKNLTIPRHIICYTIRKLRPDISMPMIGRWCGKRDHTTVLNSIWKVQKMIDEGNMRVVEVKP